MVIESKFWYNYIKIKVNKLFIDTPVVKRSYSESTFKKRYKHNGGITELHKFTGISES